MKFLTICLFAVLFFFQAALGLHFGNAGIRSQPGNFGASSGHAGGPGGPGGPPPPGPPPNSTSSS